MLSALETNFLRVARSYSHSTHSLAVDDDASLASRREGWFGAADAAAGASAGAAVWGVPVHTWPFLGLPQTRHVYVLRFPPPAAVGRLREAPPPEGSTLCDDGAVVAEAE